VLPWEVATKQLLDCLLGPHSWQVLRDRTGGQVLLLPCLHSVHQLPDALAAPTSPPVLVPGLPTRRAQLPAYLRQLSQSCCLTLHLLLQVAQLLVAQGSQPLLVLCAGLRQWGRQIKLHHEPCQAPYQSGNALVMLSLAL
jgi:hypothetical protein